MAHCFRLESGGCRDYAAAFAPACGSQQNERPRLPLSVSRSWEGHEHRICMEMGGSERLNSEKLGCADDSYAWTPEVQTVSHNACG